MAGDKRDQTVSFRLTAAELDRLKARAAKARLSVSDYARRELLAEPAAVVPWPARSESVTTAAPPTFAVWHDNTCGQTWPALVTA